MYYYALNEINIFIGTNLIEIDKTKHSYPSLHNKPYKNILNYIFIIINKGLYIIKKLNKFHTETIKKSSLYH